MRALGRFCFSIYTVSSSGLAYLPVVALALGYSTGYYGGYGALYAELFSTKIRSTGIVFCHEKRLCDSSLVL